MEHCVWLGLTENWVWTGLADNTGRTTALEYLKVIELLSLKQQNRLLPMLYCDVSVQAAEAAWPEATCTMHCPTHEI